MKIDIAGKIGQKEVEVISGDLNVHVGSNSEDYEDRDRDYGYGERSRKEEDMETTLVSRASGLIVCWQSVVR